MGCGTINIRSAGRVPPRQPSNKGRGRGWESSQRRDPQDPWGTNKGRGSRFGQRPGNPNFKLPYTGLGTGNLQLRTQNYHEVDEDLEDGEIEDLQGASFTRQAASAILNQSVSNVFKNAERGIRGTTAGRGSAPSGGRAATSGGDPP